MTLRARSCPKCHSIGDPRIVDRTLGSNEPMHCQDPWHVESAEPPRVGRFEELLAAEHEQFDPRSELLASVVEYRDAPSGTASAPRAAPPDTPDLHAARQAFWPVIEAQFHQRGQYIREVLDAGVLVAMNRALYAGLAAVLPAHRRQVLAEAADELRPVKRRLFSVLIAVVDRLDQPYPDAPEHTPWTRFVKPAMHNLDAAIRRLAPAAPETAPRPRQGDETAPAVPEQALPEGKTTVTDTLYAVHIEGPDDVIAAVDKSEAEEKAGEINAFAAEFAARPDSSELDPKFHANVIEWPYSADDHAEEVQRKDRWDL